MKVLIRKIKRANKIALSIYVISTLLFLGSYVFFTKEILSLVGIETGIRIGLLVFFFIWFIAYILFGLSTILTRKFKKFIALTVFQVLFLGILVVASIFIHKLYSKVEMFTQDEYTLYTTNLIALNSAELNSNSKLGMINNQEDIEGYVLANTLKNNEKLTQEVIYYDDYYIMLNALYNHEVDAVFVSSNYAIIFGSEATFENIGSETKVLYDYSEKLKTKTITASNKKLTEPFTMLLMGVDSEKDGLNANAAFNGDTLMLISFNPNTLTATMFSIPRDTYVPIACNHNRLHKINSSAAYGTECVINTVQNLVGVNIDYYAKINFNGVIDLVNALDGIDVEVEAPDYKPFAKKYGEGKLCESNSLRDLNHMVCMDVGMQHLNGEQTLAYARNRHGFLESDLARNRHQQQIVEALAKKVMKVSSFSDFEHLLDVIGKNIATNLSTTQILSFYQTLKNMLINGLKGNDFITIQKTYMEVYNLPVVVSGMTLSALGYYEGSLQAIHDAFEVTLGIKDEDMIKTFSYDFNEKYSSPVIGKGITGNKNQTTVPNFIGRTVTEAEEWANNNGISLNKEFTCSTATPGLIGNQSVMIGTSVKSISSMTISINQVCSNTTTPEPEKPKDDSETDPVIPGSPTETPSDTPNNGGNNEPEEPNIPGIPEEPNDTPTSGTDNED